MSRELNHKEAARLLGINERTLSRLVAESEIQRVKRGREILYSEADIQGLLSSSSRAVEDVRVYMIGTPKDQSEPPADQFEPYITEHKNNKTIEYGEVVILFERDGWQFRRDRTIKYLPDDEVFAIRELRKIFHPSHSVLQDTIRLYGIDDL